MVHLKKTGEDTHMAPKKGGKKAGTRVRSAISGRFLTKGAAKLAPEQQLLKQ